MFLSIQQLGQSVTVNVNQDGLSRGFFFGIVERDSRSERLADTEPCPNTSTSANIPAGMLGFFKVLAATIYADCGFRAEDFGAVIFSIVAERV